MRRQETLQWYNYSQFTFEKLRLWKESNLHNVWSNSCARNKMESQTLLPVLQITADKKLTRGSGGRGERLSYHPLVIISSNHFCQFNTNISLRCSATAKNYQYFFKTGIFSKFTFWGPSFLLFSGMSIHKFLFLHRWVWDTRKPTSNWLTQRFSITTHITETDACGISHFI